MGSFSYTPRASNCLVFRQVGGLSDLTHAVSFLVVRRMGSFSYTPRVRICFVVRQEGNISYASRPSICLGLVGSLFYTTLVGICLVVRRLWSFFDPPRSRNCPFVRRIGSFSNTPCAQICLFVRRGECPAYTPYTGNWLISQGWIGSVSFPC